MNSAFLYCYLIGLFNLFLLLLVKIFTEINGNVVTLSKPLTVAIPAGISLACSPLFLFRSLITLPHYPSLIHSSLTGVEKSASTSLYRPFGPPGTAEYNETLAGWVQYVVSTANFTSTVLGTKVCLSSLLFFSSFLLFFFSSFLLFFFSLTLY
jgi:hypothetical protein